MELSTITAGQAKWTARWQTRIPGQRTIEAWTRLHIVLSEPAGRNSFGPPAARSTRRLSSPRQTELDLVHVHHRNRRDSPVTTGVRYPSASPRPVPVFSPAGFGLIVCLLPYDDYFWAFGRRTLHCEQPPLHPPLRTPARLATAACLSAQPNASTERLRCECRSRRPSGPSASRFPLRGHLRRFPPRTL